MSWNIAGRHGNDCAEGLTRFAETLPLGARVTVLADQGSLTAGGCMRSKKTGGFDDVIQRHSNIQVTSAIPTPQAQRESTLGSSRDSSVAC